MLAYSELDYTGPVLPPPPALNGGLYTGTPFKPGSGWANVPIVPQTENMILALKSANPPINALKLYPGSLRPGNNQQENPLGTVFYPNTRILVQNE